MHFAFHFRLVLASHSNLNRILYRGPVCECPHTQLHQFWTLSHNLGIWFLAAYLITFFWSGEFKQILMGIAHWLPNLLPLAAYSLGESTLAQKVIPRKTNHNAPRISGKGGLRMSCSTNWATLAADPMYRWGARAARKLEMWVVDGNSTRRLP